MDNVHCQGEEEFLSHRRSNDWGNHDYNHGEDASVDCIPLPYWASRAYLGNTTLETQRKKKRLSYAGTSSNENHANFAFLLLYSSIPISPFLTLQISLSFANFSHFQLGELRKKLAGELNFFVIFVCIKGYQSSDSLPFKEAFVKRVSNLRQWGGGMQASNGLVGL